MSIQSRFETKPGLKANFNLIEFSKICGRKVQNLVWATDVHFDHIHKNDKGKIGSFVDSVRKQKPDLLLLTGDIDLGQPDKCGNLGVIETVKKIQTLVGCDVFFVLGNHDFYYEYFENVRAKANNLTLEKDHVFYLHKKGAVELNQSTAMIGIDGWYDGQEGDLLNSNVIISDFIYIRDFNDKTKICDEKLSPFTEEMKKKLIELAKPGIDFVMDVLPKLFKNYKKVVLATHVPPFLESCYESIENFASKEVAPFHVSKSLGDALLKIMKKFPNNELLVLCGHSHFHADYSPLKNLRVITGKAEYKDPIAQKSINISQRLGKKESLVDRIKNLYSKLTNRF